MDDKNLIKPDNNFINAHMFITELDENMDITLRHTGYAFMYGMSGEEVICTTLLN